MSEQDDAASVSASQKSTHATSMMDDIARDGLTPHHLESLYTDLPSDATALKAIVGTMRLELSKKHQSILQLKDEMDQVKASHSVILQRSAEWQDELETLRLRVPQLEQELRTEKHAREAESDRVKDLRIRAEESRRAIMRLQGEQSDARAKAKVDNRRSWVSATTNPPPVRDELQDAELKKSKRASLVFGPNALNLNTANRPTSAAGAVPSHRRTASGSRSVSGASKPDVDEAEEPLSPTLTNGLRGLRLSGTAGTTGTTGTNPAYNSLLLPVAAEEHGGSAPNSRRSSWLSDSGKSPRLSPADLAAPSESNDTAASSASRLSVPASVSGAQRCLLSSPALSQGAASSIGVGSPIMEDNEEEEAANSIITATATATATATVSKALPTLPCRESSINLQAYDRELRAKEVHIERLTREMTEMRLSMEEAIEARKASEACLKALRDFIATHDAEADTGERQMGDHADRIVQRASFGAGLLKGVKLPPLPTDDIDDDEEAAHLSPDTNGGRGGGGWGMKLPALMRKATSSSCPADEAGTALSPEPASSAAAGGSGASTSVEGGTAAKSIGSSFAGFSNLLSRSAPSAAATAATDTPHTTACTASASPSSESVMSSPTADQVAAAQTTTFKGFNWFKRASVLSGSSTPHDSASAGVAHPGLVEETVLSPPFRSLDHDQLSIARHSTLADHASALSKRRSSSSSPCSSAPPTTANSNSNALALALAAKFGDHQHAQHAAHMMQNAQPELSDRAQRAALKTGHVEHLTDVVPSFD